MPDGANGRRVHGPGPWLLGACLLWLVVQNTLLALALLWLEPRPTMTLAAAVIKAGAVLISSFWTSPVAPLSLGVVLIAGLVAPVLLGRQTGREVSHG